MKRIQAIFVTLLVLALALSAFAAVHLGEPKPVCGRAVLTKTAESSGATRDSTMVKYYVTTEGYKYNTIYGNVVISAPNRSDSGVGTNDSGIIRLWAKYTLADSVKLDSGKAANCPDTMHVDIIGTDTTLKPEIFFWVYVSDSNSAVGQVVKYDVTWNLYLK